MDVQLVDHMGSDLRIVEAARVSIGKNRTVEWEETGKYGTLDFTRNLTKRDHGTVKYMLENRHGTPFEHVLFTFYVQSNIGVVREAQRHRHTSWSELSTRYAVLERRFELPAFEDFRSQVGKPGHYTFEPLPPVQAKDSLNRMLVQCNLAFDLYESLLQEGCAKEVARSVLPLATVTEAYMTINLRSLFNFLGLRLHSTALREIQYMSQEMLKLAWTVVPETLTIWQELGQPIGDELHDCDSCDYHLEEVS